MRQSLATAIHSKSLQQKESHTSIDLIGAMGIAGITSPIGMAAVRFIDGLQANAHKELTFALARQAGKKIKCDKQILLRVANQVIYESAFNFCKTCNGRKEALIEKKLIRCETCNGTGLHRHTDMQRAKAIGVSLEIYLKHWESRLSEVQSIFTNEQRNGLHTVKRVMET